MAASYCASAMNFFACLSRRSRVVSVCSKPSSANSEPKSTSSSAISLRCCACFSRMASVIRSSWLMKSPSRVLPRKPKSWMSILFSPLRSAVLSCETLLLKIAMGYLTRRNDPLILVLLVNQIGIVWFRDFAQQMFRQILAERILTFVINLTQHEKRTAETHLLELALFGGAVLFVFNALQLFQQRHFVQTLLHSRFLQYRYSHYLTVLNLRLHAARTRPWFPSGRIPFLQASSLFAPAPSLYGLIASSRFQ